MEILLFGIWDIPISNYWFFYGILGVVGFFLCYFNRYLIALIVPIMVWFAVSDIQHFYRPLSVGPDTFYIFSVIVAMSLAGLASIYGAILNNRKAKPLK